MAEYVNSLSDASSKDFFTPNPVFKMLFAKLLSICYLEKRCKNATTRHTSPRQSDRETKFLGALSIHLRPFHGIHRSCFFPLLRLRSATFPPDAGKPLERNAHRMTTLLERKEPIHKGKGDLTGRGRRHARPRPAMPNLHKFVLIWPCSPPSWHFKLHVTAQVSLEVY